ncbi:hypothetical protein ADG881_2147 [Alcanivorax sp. DG881]|jgi:hypothetical protein|nr:hypothetical protein ADG881_2147 [Alcanivorax sp. DG881]
MFADLNTGRDQAMKNVMTATPLIPNSSTPKGFPCKFLKMP